MRKAVLYIGMSLDGFIADKDGGVEWMMPDSENGGQISMGSYPEFIKDVDTVLMGWRTYRQISEELSPKEWPYEGMNTFIFTHKEKVDQEQISFIDEAPEAFLKKLKKEQGKDIWICGGPDLINQLIPSDSIDQYWITVLPIILGSGIKLFQERDFLKKLKLISGKEYGGMVDLRYSR